MNGRMGLRRRCLAVTVGVGVRVEIVVVVAVVVVVATVTVVVVVVVMVIGGEVVGAVRTGAPVTTGVVVITAVVVVVLIPPPPPLPIEALLLPLHAPARAVAMMRPAITQMRHIVINMLTPMIPITPLLSCATGGIVVLMTNVVSSTRWK